MASVIPLRLVIVILSVLVIARAVVVDPYTRVVGGADIRITSFPYVASLRRKSCSSCPFEHYASGTIFSERIVITSASAVQMEAPRQLMVVAGTNYRSVFDGMLFPVEKIVIHEKYEQSVLDHDIALLKLKVDLPMNLFPGVRALNISETAPNIGSSGTVAGWGKVSEDGDYSETLRQVDVSIVNSSTCESAHQFFDITDTMICAGQKEGGRDACQGDAGSPLVVSGEYVGIVSWGTGCARPNIPGVYTNLVKLRDWVHNTAVVI